MCFSKFFMTLPLPEPRSRLSQLACTASMLRSACSGAPIIYCCDQLRSCMLCSLSELHPIGSGHWVVEPLHSMCSITHAVDCSQISVCIVMTVRLSHCTYALLCIVQIGPVVVQGQLVAKFARHKCTSFTANPQRAKLSSGPYRYDS